jgi:hypothetical protein
MHATAQPGFPAMVAAPKSEVEAKIVKPADRKISDVRAYCVYCYPYHGVVVAFSFAAMVALVLAGNPLDGACVSSSTSQSYWCQPNALKL